MHTPADFRSDTVTRPTSAMREAMLAAAVGDDVLGHDPTTLELERAGARLLNKDTALYVPSGTMANLIALSTHCRPGDEVILEEWAHTARFEGGGAGALAHAQVRTVGSRRGAMDAGEVDSWITEGSEHTPSTALVCMEQTHNFHGGAVVPREALAAVSDAAHRKGVAVHLDGARLWNACAATGIEPADYADLVDTVSVCLSKGLGAPVGSLIAGPADFIERARYVRKRLGGGMRQSGVIAAAGLVALVEMRERLPEDHARVRRIADTLAATDGFEVDVDAVDTNIVFVETPAHEAAKIVDLAADAETLLYATGPRQIRFVTHYDVDDDDVDRLLDLLTGLSTA